MIPERLSLLCSIVKELACDPEKAVRGNDILNDSSSRGIVTFRTDMDSSKGMRTQKKPYFFLNSFFLWTLSLCFPMDSVSTISNAIKK